MSDAQGSRSGKEVRRRWRIPPPILSDADSPGPEGLNVVGEFQNELGVLLWKVLRSILLWADIPAADRPGLFSEGAVEQRQLEILSAVPPNERSLRESLESLLPLYAAPERVDREQIGVACHRIATWADGKEAPQTALEFIQAASLACPGNGQYALAVAKASRDLAQYARAEAWYQRAVGLARQSKDWETYAIAYLSHGNMLRRRGALPAARRSFIKALRRARRQGVRELEAKALHDLHSLELQAGRRERAMELAVSAIRAYGPSHPSLPILAHDVAYAWVEAGRHGHALPVLMEMLPKIPATVRPVGLGSIARAAGGVGDASAFDWSVDQLESYSAAPGVAEAWVEVARGAILLGRHDEARQAVATAESMAAARGEGHVRFMAESILEAAEAERAASVASSDMSEEATAADDQVARELLKTLKAAPVALMDV